MAAGSVAWSEVHFRLACAQHPELLAAEVTYPVESGG